MNKKILSLSVLILLGVLVVSVVSASWLTGNAISSKKTASIGKDSLVTLDSGKYIVAFGTSSTASLADVSIYRAVGSTRGSLIQRLELEKGDIETLTSLPLQIAFTKSSITGGVNKQLKFYFTLSDVVCASGESWSNGECVSEDWETEDEEVTYAGVLEMLGSCGSYTPSKDTASNYQTCDDFCSKTGHGKYIGSNFITNFITINPEGKKDSEVYSKISFGTDYPGVFPINKYYKITCGFNSGVSCSAFDFTDFVREQLSNSEKSLGLTITDFEFNQYCLCCSAP